MSIKFACPGCRQSLKVSSKFAGRALKCPKCEQKLRVPTPRVPAMASSAAGLAGVPMSKSKDLTENAPAPIKRATLSRPTAVAKKPAVVPTAPAGGLPFNDDDWEEALNPYVPPQEESDPGPPRGDEDKLRYDRSALRWARRGLMAFNWGLNGVALSILMMLLISFLGSNAAHPAARALALIALGVYFVSGLLLFVGPYICLFTPESTGARSPVVLTCVAQTTAVALVLALITGSVSNSSELAVTGLLLAGAVMTSYFSFLQYLTKIAKHVHRQDIADSVNLVTTLGVVNVVGTLVVYASPLLAIQFEDFGYLFGALGILSGIVLLVCGLIAVGKYAAAVNKLAQAV